ncbi:MAG: zinc ribbon domain-containing protein [Longimonas sp.]|uniref:FmdB family zinc ribbon protein n=1 Tax=Longimonas sp. TaxID=2039626 RepID=UPI00334E339B
MPTYVYRREDGTKFEIKQSITDDPLTTCPETGQPVERIISGSAGLIFKGSGFYETDYKRKGKTSTSNGTTSTSTSGSTSSSESSEAGSKSAKSKSSTSDDA